MYYHDCLTAAGKKMVLAKRFYGVEISRDIGLPSSSQNFTSYVFDVDVNFCMDLSNCLVCYLSS